MVQANPSFFIDANQQKVSKFKYQKAKKQTKN